MFIVFSLVNSLGGNHRVRCVLYILTQDFTHSLRYQRLYCVMMVVAKNGTALHHLSVSLPRKEIISNTMVQISPGLLLEWHLTYLGNKPTVRVENFKEEVAPPWPLMPRKIERKGRNNRTVQAQLDLLKDFVPKDAKACELQSGAGCGRQGRIQGADLYT